MSLLLLIIFILIVFSALWFFVWSWFFRINQKNVVRFKKVAKKAIEKGNYKRAKELILKALKIGRNLELEYQLGISQVNLNEIKDAQRTFENILNENPEDINIMLQLAAVLFDDKKYDKSLELYEKILTNDSSNIEALIGKAKILVAQKKYAKALVLLDKVSEVAPDNNQVIVLILQCKSELINIDNKEEYDEIINQFVENESNNEKSFEFNLSYAKIYAKNGEVERPIELCKRAIESNSSEMQAYQMLGLLYLVKKDYQSAKNILNVAFGLDAKNEETHKIFSYVLCQQVDNCPLQLCREKYFELIKQYFK